MEQTKKFLVRKRVTMLGFTAAFLTIAALSLFYVADTWASSSDYYTNLQCDTY